MGEDILIAGGGIGGLTAALCLERAGLPCIVFEAAPEAKELGVGINLLPHSVRVLTRLSLASELASIAIPTAELAYFSKFGQRIWSEPRRPPIISPGSSRATRKFGHGLRSSAVQKPAQSALDGRWSAPTAFTPPCAGLSTRRKESPCSQAGCCGAPPPCSVLFSAGGR